MDLIPISFTVRNSDPTIPLGLEVWVGDQQLYNSDHVFDLETVTVTITDDEAEHELRLVLKHKQLDHTKIDDQGNILKDAYLIFDNFLFDEVDCDILVHELSRYHHDFNGTSDPVTEAFYGAMGCNGAVKLQFTTPLYLWLLENM